MSYERKKKCSSLVPPWDKLSLTWSQIKPIDVNFHLQKSLEIFDENSADKIWSKKYKEIKVTPLMPIRVKRKSPIKIEIGLQFNYSRYTSKTKLETPKKLQVNLKIYSLVIFLAQILQRKKI